MIFEQISRRKEAEEWKEKEKRKEGRKEGSRFRE